MSIQITWTADAKVAERSIEAIARKNERLIAQIQRLAGDSKLAAEAQARTGKVIVKSAEDAEKALLQQEQRQAELLGMLDRAKAKKKEEEAQAQRLAAQNAKLAAAAKRVYEETRTPQERYAAKLRELDDLLKKNQITQQTYGRAVKQAGGHLARRPSTSSRRSLPGLPV